MYEERITFDSGGYALIGLASYPASGPAPGVIMFHGLTNAKDDCPLINETTEMLIGEGFATLRFDFFGSGESPGLLEDKTMNILEQNALDAIEFFASDERVTQIGLWGRSIGGTLIGLVGHDPRIRASVIASGQMLVEKATRERFETIKRKEEELAKQGKRLPGTGHYKGRFGFKRAWFDSLKGLDERVCNNLTRLHTVLILHTSPDQKVPLENIEVIINNVREPKGLHIFEGVDHDYSGAEDLVVEYERTWFNRHLR